jgi:cytochrome d ubiquinol oxidase subunit I
MEKLELQNPIFVPKALSWLTYRRFSAEVKGLTAFPRDEWPDNVPLVYFSYHIMVGLGSIFVAITLLALLLLWKKRLYRARWLLWTIMLTAPFPYIATMAGWVTAEAGRQPWAVWGLMRTYDAGSPPLNTGNVMFTLLGFFAMCLMLGVIYCLLIFRIVLEGPEHRKV